MMGLDLHCPICHHLSGNALTVDWPEPLEPRCFRGLICKVCGIEFAFAIHRMGMSTEAMRPPPPVLADFLERRKRNHNANPT